MIMPRTMRIHPAMATAAGINPVALLSLVLATIGALLSENPWSSCAGLAGLVMLIKFFWTRRQPAIMFWALLHQWLQINAGLIYADILGEDLSAIFTYKVHSDEAYLLGMASLFALGLGIWLMTHKLSREPLNIWLNRLDPKKCLNLYLAFIIAFSIILKLRLPGAGQILFALGFLKWGFFYIFFSAVLHTGRYRLLLAVCMLLEFVFSLYSYFAGFRAILIMPLMILPVFFKGRIRFISLLTCLLLTTLIINVGIVWTAVKMEYRRYVAQGVKGQVINVGRNDALRELGHLVSQLDGARYQAASIAMVQRIFYLDFLSGVIGYVPASLPHENGAITFKALTHVVTPRILFPEKEALHDSLHLNKYLGRFVADYQTTSMSIGYVGDLYIDFGFMAPLAVFVLGLLNGYLYRLLYRQDASGGWGLFLAMPLFFLFYLFEISLVKLIGMMITYVLVMMMVAKFMLPLIKRNVERGIPARNGRTAHANPRRALLPMGKRL